MKIKSRILLMLCLFADIPVELGRRITQNDFMPYGQYKATLLPYTLCLKKRHWCCTVAHYNCDWHEGILIILGRCVTRRISNYKRFMPLYAIAENFNENFKNRALKTLKISGNLLIFFSLKLSPHISIGSDPSTPNVSVICATCGTRPPCRPRDKQPRIIYFCCVRVETTPSEHRLNSAGNNSSWRFSAP